MKKLILLCSILALFVMMTLFIGVNGPTVQALESSDSEVITVVSVPATLTIWDVIAEATSNIQTIIGLVTLLITLAAFTLRLYAKYTTNKKAKAAAESLAAKLDVYKQVASKINEWVEQAELFAGYAGAEKKQYVLTKVNQYCIDNKIEYDADMVSGLIESAVALTKSVNARGTTSKTKAVVENEIL